MVIILGKKIEATFRIRSVMEEALNRCFELEGEQRKSLYYFFKKYYGDVDSEGYDMIPASVLKELVAELYPEKDIALLTAEETRDLSDSIGVLIAECWAGGRRQKSFDRLSDKKAGGDKKEQGSQDDDDQCNSYEPLLIHELCLTAVTTFKLSITEFYETTVNTFLTMVYLYCEQMQNKEGGDGKPKPMTITEHRALKRKLDKMKKEKEKKNA